MRPAVVGAAMGAMMLWMLHDRLMQGGGLLGPAVAFVVAHVAVVGMWLLAVVLLARRWPGARARLRRLHRPSPGHMARMGGGAVASAVAIHLVLHGGLA